MPKGGGRATGSKTPQQSTSAIQDDSNVVFAHSGKVKKGDEQKGKGKEEANRPQNPGEEAAKKPDVRTLIGGASWTGKLPMNLLSEHCQKQKWSKPEYITRNDAGGVSSMVVLHGINPKTREPLRLPPFKLPPTHQQLAIQPSAVESRHFAATYTLFRICSMKNIHMMLPPMYKDLWKNEFDQLKKEDAKQNRSWMYDPDPFATWVERQEAQAVAAKQREEREKQKSKEAQHPLISIGSTTTNSGKLNHHSIMKGWTRVPKVDLGKRIRTQIEDLVRKHAVWNPYNIVMSTMQKQHIMEEFARLGFRSSHIEEALDECGDREEALEWLLIHVPDDDLPKWSLPEGYTAGLTLASGNLRREASIGRLANAGYPTELCAKFLDDADEDENQAAEKLQNTLFTAEWQTTMQTSEASSIDNTETWKEERETLKAIYDDRFTFNAAAQAPEIKLHIPSQKETFVLQIRKSRMYPRQPPTVCILAPGIPAYIRLSTVRKAIEYAQEKLLGDPMIFQMIDWLEAEIPSILSNPGKLRDLSMVPRGNSLASRTPHKNHERGQRRTQVDGKSSTTAKSAELLRQWHARQDSPQQRIMMAQRQRLPAWKLGDDIFRVVKNHQVTIISGETGSGKSTQSVQLVLDAMIQENMGAAVNIVCTQPRRISALGLADRVSEERCSPVGQEVGYSIRGESRQKPGTTKITFMTIGVLLRRLQTSGGSKEDVVTSLADISHVFVDEVHERSLDTDFLLALLRDVLTIRKDLKVVLMSATLDSGIFEHYFGPTATVGRVEIPGRTFAVEDYYLDDVVRLTDYKAPSLNPSQIEDAAADEGRALGSAIQHIGMKINYELIAATVRALDSQYRGQDGGILIFLPGTLEINRTIEAVRAVPGIHALPLHASLTPAEQRQVFPRAPPGKRKVVAATNVAETSITIEDIVAVIDCGRVKETSFDPQTNMVKLEETWASRAACKQRRGRAGRVQAGECYKLYTRNAESKMAERPDPEIKRVPLEQLCLSVRSMGIEDVSGFLGSTITPPDILAVESALKLLNRMGATEGNELTALGRHMSMIPADLRCGKLMVYGAAFGCLDACLTIASILSCRSPFLSPQTKRDESKAARTAFATGQGDLVCDLRAYEAWSQTRRASSPRDTRIWCEQNFLSTQTLHDIASNRVQLASALAESGCMSVSRQLHNSSSAQSGQTVATDSLNVHNSNSALIRALISASFNPQIARISYPDKKFAASHTGAVELDPEAKTIKYFSEDNGRVFVHPSSTLFDAQGFAGGSAAVFMSYFAKMATSKIFIRELTPFNAFTALMFGGPLEVDTMGRGIVLDGWLRIRGWARIGVLAGRLRGILDSVLREMAENPEAWSQSGEVDEIVKIVRRLIEFDGMDR